MMTATYDASWKKAFHDGFVPGLTVPQLEVLRDALVKDDPTLIQGATTTPPPLQVVQDWPVEAACAIGYCGWKGGTLATDTVADVEEFFARACFDCDTRLAEPAGCRWFLNFYDETPRQEMRALLLVEVNIALDRKKAENVVV